MLRAVSPPNVARLLAAGTVGSSVTGTTDETALATVTIPAGAMGTNGGLLIYSTWSHTNSANTKTPRIRFGGIAGTIFFSITPTTSASSMDPARRIRNRNSASSQVGSGPAAGGVSGSSGNAVVTATINTAAAADLVFTGQLANSGETITLENYEVWLTP